MGTSISAEFGLLVKKTSLEVQRKQWQTQCTTANDGEFTKTINSFYDSKMTPQILSNDNASVPIDIGEIFEDPELEMPTSPLLIIAQVPIANAQDLRNTALEAESVKLLEKVLAPTKNKQHRRNQLNAILKAKSFARYKGNIPSQNLIEHLIFDMFKTSGYEDLFARKMHMILECALHDEEGRRKLEECEQKISQSNINFHSLVTMVLHYRPNDLELFKVFLDLDLLGRTEQAQNSLLPFVLTGSTLMFDTFFKPGRFTASYDAARAHVLREVISSGKLNQNNKNGCGIFAFRDLSPLMIAVLFGMSECVKELVVNKIGGSDPENWRNYRVSPKVACVGGRGYVGENEASEGVTEGRKMKEKDEDAWTGVTYCALQLVCSARYYGSSNTAEVHKLEYNRRMKEIAQILMTLPGAKEEAYERSVLGKSCIDLAKENGNDGVLEVLMANNKNNQKKEF